jgi:hypothetical protein
VGGLAGQHSGVRCHRHAGRKSVGKGATC